MKRILYLLAIILALFSCHKSNESKINALIKSDLSEVMHDFNSYEPISTDLDSVFDAAFFDENAWSLSEKIVENNEMLESIESDIERLRFDLDMAGVSRNRQRIKELTDRGDRLLSDMKSKIDENKDLRDSIRSINDLAGHDFVGYLCNHKFRCNNGMGNKILVDAGFFIDAECTKIMYRIFDDEDEKQVAQIAASLNKMED